MLRKTDTELEQILYALFRKIAYGDYKYLKDNTPGKAIPVQITGFDERKLKITLLNSFTGFDLSVKDQVSGLTYTIDEKGYLNRPGNQ